MPYNTQFIEKILSCLSLSIIIVSNKCAKRKTDRHRMLYIWHISLKNTSFALSWQILHLIISLYSSSSCWSFSVIEEPSFCSLRRENFLLATSRSSSVLFLANLSKKDTRLQQKCEKNIWQKSYTWQTKYLSFSSSTCNSIRVTLLLPIFDCNSTTVSLICWVCLLISDSLLCVFSEVTEHWSLSSASLWSWSEQNFNCIPCKDK